MTTALTTLTSNLAKQFNMGDGSELASTLKATCFKSGTQVTDAQMTALLVVAQQYGLNPFTKEIYAFPDKGGIVPVVGLDGWSRIINSRPEFDGMDFDQNPESCTCTIYRKDRSHPIKVTEWMAECKRNAGPWLSHPYRMLRHKAMIQCARIAFGFAGIYEPDEAERIVESVNSDTGEVIRKPAKPVGNPAYSDADFEKNLPAWQRLIENGKRTAEEVIAMVSSKAVMSDEQIALLKECVSQVTDVEVSQ